MKKDNLKKLLNVINSKPVIGLGIFIMLSLAVVFAGDVIVKEGSLTVDNNLNSSNVLFVNQTTGRVGIGTSNPSYVLDVNGKIYSASGRVPSGTLFGGISENNIFDALSPKVPNIGDKLIVSGGYESYPVAYIQRTSSTVITFYCGPTAAPTATDGSATVHGVALAW